MAPLNKDDEERLTARTPGEKIYFREHRWKIKKKVCRSVSGCLFIQMCPCVCFFHAEQLLVVNLARASISCREVIDVCSIQKACWETVTDLSQTPWTPRTWPNAFRNSQMAAIEGFAVPNLCTCVCVCAWWSMGTWACLSVRLPICLSFSVFVYTRIKSRFKQGCIRLVYRCWKWLLSKMGEKKAFY